jgi:AcrR family transcriptional regulator
MDNTKERILDSAERILSQGGLTALSLRPVTAAAGVNLSAVNYHFRSKEELIHQVFARRLGPLNRQRLAALDECESRARGKGVPLDELLHAFIGPIIKLSREESEFVGLIGQMYSEPSLDIQRIFGEEIDEVVKRFSAAFRRALPDTPPDDIFYSLFFTTGAMFQALGAPTLLKFVSGGLCDPSNLEMLESQLIRFTKAGLSANPRTKRKKQK